MKLSEENKREKDFHDNLHKSEGERFENRFYKALANMFSDFDSQIEQNCKNKRILDFGCGIGNNLVGAAEHGIPAPGLASTPPRV